jgi:transcriptional regulator with XRE-family HTH domain
MHSASADDLLEFFAANVRRLRLRQGLTQEQLAEVAGLDTTYIQRIERGEANPTLRVLADVADSLGVRVPRLLQTASAQVRHRGRPPKRPSRG